MKTNFKEEMEQKFGVLTPKQMWLLVKLSKNVRLRCRNNVAFNNFFNSTFPYANFSQINKIRADGSSYPGLKITFKDGQSSEEEEENE